MYGKNIDKNLKILIISQYYWPENFRINELSEELSNLGHDLTILTGLPNYPQGEIFKEFKKNRREYMEYKGARIFRVPVLPRRKNKLNLFLNYLSFTLNSILFGYFKLRKENFDILFTFQVSPVTVGFTSVFFAKIKKCPHVFWVLDLWPDTLVALEIIKKGWILNLLKITVNWIYGECDLILAQSKKILRSINTYPAVKNNARYFPTWGESNLFEKAVKPANEIKEKKIFTILFAGNIGKAQDFPSLIKSVEILSKVETHKFRIILVGDGSEKESTIREVKRKKLEKYFEFYKHYPVERMSSFFLHADALLVTLSNKKVFNMTVPGKIQFYLSSGIPIIGMLSGEGASIIKESKGGIVCPSGDYIKFSKLISEMIKKDKETLRIMGENGKKFCEKEFSKIKLINQLNKFLITTSNKK